MAKKQVTKPEEAKVKGNQQDVTWSSASSLIWKPEIGDVLIGYYDGCAEVNDELKEIMRKDGEQKVDRPIIMHYVLVDDAGVERRYSMIGGQVFDSVIKSSPIEKGTLVRFEYLGQRETKGGNRCNEYDVKYSL